LKDNIQSKTGKEIFLPRFHGEKIMTIKTENLISLLSLIRQERRINEIEESIHVALDMFTDAIDDYDIRKLNELIDREKSLTEWQLENEIFKGRIL
jgi:hypothetical protein